MRPVEISWQIFRLCHLRDICGRRIIRGGIYEVPINYSFISSKYYTGESGQPIQHE